MRPRRLALALRFGHRCGGCACSTLRKQGTAVLLVEQLLEKALAAADGVYALVQGNIVLEAPTSENNLPQRLERAYFGTRAMRR